MVARWQGEAMRGNHRVWSRNDYKLPAALADQQLTQYRTCVVVQDELRKTWYGVKVRGKLLGYVTQRYEGQSARSPEMDCWHLCATDWNPADPPHAQAVLQLFAWTSELDTERNYYG